MHQVTSLLHIFKMYQLAELEYLVKDKLQIRITRSPLSDAVIVQKRELDPEQEAPEPCPRQDHFATIVSEEIGRFYYKDFIAPGDRVSAGQEIGYILSLGLKTSVTATVNGTIADIPVKNGGIVDYGRILVTIASG